MTSLDARNRRWLMTAGGLAVAATLGFGIAKLTTRPEPPAVAAKPAAAAAGPRMLAVRADYLITASIAVQPVTAGNMAAEVLAPAAIVAAPNGEAVITAHAAGTVTRLVKRLGDPVRAGEVLALVGSREAAGAAADRSVAEAKLALARKVAVREQRLFDQRVTARQDLETAQAELVAAEAEARRARNAAAVVGVSGDGRSATVVSPIAGKITAQTATLGAYVQPDAELFRVADARLIQIEASVTGADAARISAGDKATLVTPTGDAIHATVRAVTPTLSGESRTATVILAPAGPTPSLTPGATLQARIMPKASGAGMLVIPEEAVQSVDGHDVVFVRTAKGFRVQPVAVTSRSAGRAAIASGLQAGQSVATRNAFLLKAELAKGGAEGE